MQSTFSSARGRMARVHKGAMPSNEVGSVKKLSTFTVTSRKASAATVVLQDKPVVINNKRIYEPDCWKSENEMDPLAGGEFLRRLAKETPLYEKQYQDFKRNHRIARQLYTEICLKADVPASLDLRKKSSETIRDKIKSFIGLHHDDFQLIKFPGHAPVEWRIEQIYKHMLTYRKNIRKEAAKESKISVTSTIQDAKDGLIELLLYGRPSPTLPGTSESETDDLIVFGRGRPWKFLRLQKLDFWSVEVLEINLDLDQAVYVPSPEYSPLYERDTRTLRQGDSIEIPFYCTKTISTSEADEPERESDAEQEEDEEYSESEEESEQENAVESMEIENRLLPAARVQKSRPAMDNVTHHHATNLGQQQQCIVPRTASSNQTQVSTSQNFVTTTPLRPPLVNRNEKQQPVKSKLHGQEVQRAKKKTKAVGSLY